MRSFLLLSSIFILGTLAALGQTADHIHIWVKVFIPQADQSNAEFIHRIVGNPSLSVLHALIKMGPVSKDFGCFTTDSRTFSSDEDASARLTANFVLITDGQHASTAASVPRQQFVAGKTHHVDCASGLDLEPPRTASVSGMGLGIPAIAGDETEVAITATGQDPFLTYGDLIGIGELGQSIAAPVIANQLFTFNRSTRHLKVRATLTNFPAFEAYAQLNGGPVTTLYRTPTTVNVDPSGLVDFGSGLNERTIDADVTLPTKSQADPTPPIEHPPASAAEQKAARCDSWGVHLLHNREGSVLHDC